MSADIITIGKTIDVQKLDVLTQFRRLMLAGHAIRMYKTLEPGGDMKAVSIFDSYDGLRSFHGYEMGYGRDRHNTDRAIVRALYTYSHAKRTKRKHARDYAEATHGRIVPELRGPTKLDRIVEASEREDGIILHKTEEGIMAESYIGGGDSGEDLLVVTADTTLGAIEDLTYAFNFYGLGIHTLGDGTEVDELPSTQLG